MSSWPGQDNPDPAVEAAPDPAQGAASLAAAGKAVMEKEGPEEPEKGDQHMKEENPEAKPGTEAQEMQHEQLENQAEQQQQQDMQQQGQPQQAAVPIKQEPLAQQSRHCNAEAELNIAPNVILWSRNSAR